MGKPVVFFDAYTRFGPVPRQHGAHPWTLAHLVAEMKHCSISAALATSTACTLYDPMRGNLELCETLSGHDNLYPLWNVMPHWTGEMPAPDELLEALRVHGVPAVTIAPKTNGWRVSSSTSRPLFAALERAGKLLVMDMREVEEADLEYLAETWPGLPLLMVGLRWNRQRWALPLLLQLKNLHIAFDHFQAHYGLEWLVDKGCSRQIVYASNAPAMAMGAHRCTVDYAEVDDRTRADLAAGNLLRLLRDIPAPRPHVNDDEDELMTAARHGQPLPLPVYDLHAHILDEGLQGGGGAYTMFEGGPRGVWRMAQRLGVAATGFMSWHGTVSAHAADGNRCVRAALDALPDTCWGLATFDVAHDAPEVMRRDIEETFRDPRFLGLKPYPSYGKFFDHPDYRVWWEFGRQHNLYALLHVTREDLSEVDALASAYPEMTFVVAHCGASYARADQAIRVARAYPNVIIEITLTPVCLGIIEYLVAGAGADRVAYGSDLPMRDPRPQLGWVIFSRLGLADKRKVLSENTRRLIESLRARGGP